MALDAHGNWTPVLPDQPPANPCVFTELMACTGVPDNASGFDGDIRVDLTNGNVYAKANGVWALVAGGGGGDGQVQLYPNPPADVTKPGVAFPAGGGTLYQWDPDLGVYV